MAVHIPGPSIDAEYLGSWFAIDIAGLKIDYVTEISGLAMEVGVVDFNDVNKKNVINRKRPGTATYTELTVKRLLSPDKSLWDWVKLIRDGKKEYRKNGSVILFDMDGSEIGRWTFANAWPSKWSASDLDVGTDDPMTEEVTLQIENLKREK